MNGLRIWYWKLLHGSLMDRIAELDQQLQEAREDREAIIGAAAELSAEGRGARCDARDGRYSRDGRRSRGGDRRRGD